MNHYFNDGIQGMQARLMLQNLDNIELAAEAYGELVRQALLSRPRESLIWMSIPGIGPCPHLHASPTSETAEDSRLRTSSATMSSLSPKSTSPESGRPSTE